MTELGSTIKQAMQHIITDICKSLISQLALFLRFYFYVVFFQNFEVSFYLLTSKLENQKDKTKMSIFILPDMPFNVTLKRFCRSFYKQSIFDPRPENCLNFSKKSPPKFV